MNANYFALVAQQAASLERMAQMKSRIESSEDADERSLWAHMLASYEEAMPNLNAQIQRAKVAA